MHIWFGQIVLINFLIPYSAADLHLPVRSLSVYPLWLLMDARLFYTAGAVTIPHIGPIK